MPNTVNFHRIKASRQQRQKLRPNNNAKSLTKLGFGWSLSRMNTYVTFTCLQTLPPWSPREQDAKYNCIIHANHYFCIGFGKRCHGNLIKSIITSLLENGFGRAHERELKNLAVTAKSIWVTWNWNLHRSYELWRARLEGIERTQKHCTHSLLPFALEWDKYHFPQFAFQSHSLASRKWTRPPRRLPAPATPL